MLKKLLNFTEKPITENLQPDITENDHFFTAEHELAQYVLSGALSEGFYRSVSAQFRKLNQLCKNVDNHYLAQLAIYSHETGHIKDIPAYLLALLSVRDIELTKRIFPRIINNGKMLRCFTQIIRSGVIGRRSFGSALVRIIGDWINDLSDSEILSLYIGKNPSLRDILRLVHPHPKTDEREAFYGWICQLGTKHIAYDPEKLPPIVKELEAFLRGDIDYLSPDIPHELLIAKSGYTQAQWKAIFKNCTWNQLRQSLNLFTRHGVFKNPKNIDLAVEKITDPASIEKIPLHPYAFYASLSRLDPALPARLKNALHEAFEMLLQRHLPDFKGKHVAVCLDLSSSMFSPVAAQRGKRASKIHCAEIAALSAAMIFKGNPETSLILPFSAEVFPAELDPNQSVLANMQRISRPGTGGTDCSAPLGYLLDQDIFPDVIILISDNEAWIETGKHGRRGSKQACKLWQKIHDHNPDATLICWNLAPNSAVQMSDDANILNLSGYSEKPFPVILRFSNLLPLKKSAAQQILHLVDEIKKTAF